MLLRSRVRRIQVVNGAARGIVLENGQRIEAPIVISNADALQTFEELAGLQHLPDRYVKTLRNMKPSVTAFVLFLATSLDLKEQGAAHETFFYRSWDHDQTYSENLQGKLTGITVTIPTLIDPSVAPAGEHLLTATAFLPYDIDASWQRLAKDPDAYRILEETTNTAAPNLPGKAIEHGRNWRPGKDDQWSQDESYTMPENLFLAYQRGAGSDTARWGCSI